MKQWGSEIIIEVEDVIKPEKIEEYKAELSVVLDQLIVIANNLIIMERLTNFPYHVFIPLDRRVFWSLMNRAFFNSTLLAFSTILAQGGNSISLRKFKNKVFNPAEFRIDDIDTEVQKILTQRIKNTDFEKKIELIEEQIRDVRNHHIAHLDPQKSLEPDKVPPDWYPLK